jgi:two-component system chemotaxis sensor kinase CheA
LDSILLQAEELLSAKLAASQRAMELREINAALAAWKKEWKKLRMADGEKEHGEWQISNGEKFSPSAFRHSPSSSFSPSAIRHPQWEEFLEWNSAFINALENQLAALAKSADHDQRSLGGMVDRLLDDMKKVLMLPFSSLLQSFPKLARDLSRDQGKEVELVTRGGEIEIDRRILEEMKDPLIHLVRNGIDHGIEDPKERARKQKPSRGTVTVAISQKNGSKVEVLISDDGGGIDVAKVRSTALKLGLVPQEEAEQLNAPEALSLIFRSGVSTSPVITDISGRGLGLAIVREKVEKLGGAVSVETHPEAGTTFRLVLPLTLARFRGVIVRVDEQYFVLPTTYVERVARVNKEDIKTVENRETIQLHGHAVSLVRLGDVLELPRPLQGNPQSPIPNPNLWNLEFGIWNFPSTGVPVVVLGSAEQRIAFLVDEILNEQEVLVKRLGPPLARVRNIAGATVLGTGQVVPILNVSDLMTSAVRSSSAVVKPPAAPGQEKEAERKSVLVVEDSITARTLLKNVLEAAGYEVKTAVDGIDAFTQLRTHEFDLVVSDVDMPRMNGFDLTAKIRGTQKLAELPVVLVTALDSREDRERGIDVGAHAYIVKSSFDQSNLLEVIRKLI